MDQQQLASVLAGWLAARRPGKRDIVVADLRNPSQGYSNETWLCDLAWNDDGGAHQYQPLVLRIQTTAFAIDHAAVSRNYALVKQNKETNLLPLCMDLTNPSPALGWNCAERMSLVERGPVDLVMALALVHHLAISNNTPLEDLASFFSQLGGWLVIEFIPKSDSQVKRLLSSRVDIFPDYTKIGFENAFRKYYEIVEEAPIAGSERTLYLMQRK